MKTTHSVLSCVCYIIITLMTSCVCDDTSNFDDMSFTDLTDDKNVVIPVMTSPRVFGMEPIKVSSKVLSEITDSKLGHFQKLTGKQHSHLSGKIGCQN